MLFVATAHLPVSIQHYSSTGVRVKFLSIQHYYFFLEGEKFQLVDYKKIASIQLFFIYTAGPEAVLSVIVRKEARLGLVFLDATRAAKAAGELL